jgi:hypothetical protein
MPLGVEHAAQSRGPICLPKFYAICQLRTYRVAHKETLILDNPTCQDNLSEVPKVLTKLLFDTPMLALNTKQHDSVKKVVLVFPLQLREASEDP